MQLQQENRVSRAMWVFRPALIWAIGLGLMGGGMSAAISILYAWFARHSLMLGLLQNNAALGALLGAHLGLLVTHLRSCKGDALRRDWFGILMAALLLIYAICWIAICL